MARLSLKQLAYNTVKEKILNCEYEPNSFLNEDIICDTLQMSRTPVRDALGRLEQENLIKIIPKKGFIISPISFNEINMVFEGRLLLEPYIILHYCEHIPEDVLFQMQQLLIQEKESIQQKKADIYDLDHRFHKYLIFQCPNHYFLRLYDSLHSQSSRLRILSGRSSDDRLSRTLEEHLKILEALTQNNSSSASELMRIHLENAKESSFQAFFKKHSYI